MSVSSFLRSFFCPRCFSFGTGETCIAHNPVKHPYSKAMTPDELIVAHCIHRIASDFDNWKFQKQGHIRHIYNDATFHDWINNGQYRLFYFPKFQKGGTKIEIDFEIYDSEPWGDIQIKGHVVEKGKDIVAAWWKIATQRLIIKQQADRAKQKMEADKKKWDFAEELIGLKRLPSGALVPKDYKEEIPECDNQFIGPSDVCRSTACCRRK